MRRYCDLKRSKGLTLKEGDKVYLSSENFKLKRLKRKLDFRKQRVYIIEKEVYKDIYKLKLPL